MIIGKVLLCCFFGVELLLAAYMHGKPKNGYYSFWSTVLDEAIILGLLWWGGFFK